MMLDRLPVIPTVLVLIAVAVMLRLGVWQLDRKGEKEALIARYQAAAGNTDIVPWPAIGDDGEVMLYRRSRLTCASTTNMSAQAGKNRQGRAGVAITAQCKTPEGKQALVALGWSMAPSLPEWGGGEVTGTIAPGPRLVADPPLAGLEANAVPDPSEVPNNHLSYAVQWFLFAAVALVIYGLAVRKRLAGDAGGR